MTRPRARDARVGAILRWKRARRRCELRRARGVLSRNFGRPREIRGAQRSSSPSERPSRTSRPSPLTPRRAWVRTRRLLSDAPASALREKWCRGQRVLPTSFWQARRIDFSIHRAPFLFFDDGMNDDETVSITRLACGLGPRNVANHRESRSDEGRRVLERTGGAFGPWNGL